MTTRCECLECQLRRVLIGDEATGPAEIDTAVALRACGEVMAEMLAHYPTQEAKRFTRALLAARKKWQSHPRVLAQHPIGNA